MVRHWNGIITIGKVKSEVNVTIELPNDKLGQWYGHGNATINDIALLHNEIGKNHKTEIGDLFINKLDMSNGLFSFQGSGMPKI